MPVFDTIVELWNGKKYKTATNINMKKSNSSETSPIMSAHENNVRNDSEARILTHKEVDEQIRNYIAPLTTQAEDLTWLTQGVLHCSTAKSFPKGR